MKSSYLYPTFKELDEASIEQVRLWHRDLPMAVTVREMALGVRIRMRLDGTYVP